MEKMNKELQDLTWRSLPKEFKEEVKKTNTELNCNPDMAQYRLALQQLFGIHNLTSDAEGEEMLTISRREIQQLVAANDIVILEAAGIDNIETIQAKTVNTILNRLFGSKCLPDNGTDCTPVKEPKAAEPKFKHNVGDEVKYKLDREAHKIAFIDKGLTALPYQLKNGMWASESDLEPCTEPEKESPKKKPIESKVSVYIATKEEDEEFRMLLHENGFKWYVGTSLISETFWSSLQEETKIYYLYPNKTVTYCGDKTSDTLTFSEFKKQYFGEETSPNVNHSDIDIDELVAKGYVPDPAKQFDAIIKDGFLKERRLNIAAMIMAAMMQNAKWGDKYSHIASMSCAATDALIAESEKGDNS